MMDELLDPQSAEHKESGAKTRPNEKGSLAGTSLQGKN